MQGTEVTQVRVPKSVLTCLHVFKIISSGFVSDSSPDFHIQRTIREIKIQMLNTGDFDDSYREKKMKIS